MVQFPVARWLLPLLLAATPGFAAVSGGAPAATVSVETQGFLPGLGKAELPAHIATQMNGANAGAWRFVANGNAPDRVVWSFKTGPSANGAVRTYGFSRAMMERLVGAHHFVTIEAKLYLKGDYQCGDYETATIGPQMPDSELSATIVRMTRILMSCPSENSREPSAGLAASARTPGAMIP